MTRRWLALATLAACQHGGESAPAVGSGSATPGPTARLVGCAPAGAIPSAPTVAGPAAMGRPDPAVTPMAPAGWYPYARRPPVADDLAAPIAARAKAVLAEHLGKLDICLTGKVGSVVAMLDVGVDGRITARVGGIGHRPTEDCLATEIGKLMITGASRPVELECGLSTPAAGPLRVTTAGGYRRVDVGHAEVRLDGLAQKLDGDHVAAPRPHDDAAYLVIADPDAPGALLDGVMSWLAEAPAVLIAVAADGGAPVFLAMGPDRRPFHAPDAPRVDVEIAGGKLAACVEHHREAAVPLLQPHVLDKAMRGAITACGGHCDDVVEVGGAGYVAKDLVAATSAVRRAGLDPVMVVGARCGPD